MKKYYDTIPMGGGGESPVEAAAKEIDNYDLERLYEWVIDDKRNPAITAFTSGIARNIASHIELLLWQKSNPVEQGQGEAWTAVEDVVYAAIKRWHSSGSGTKEIIDTLKKHYHLIKK